MTSDIHETASRTENFQTKLAAQLADLIPEAIADGKVDVEKLKELLGSDTTDSSERFGLFWPGKRRALRAAQEPTTATLKPDFENSKSWSTTQNLFIEGDNLEVLKVLQKHYHNKVKLIYIDPPYNTGNDFVYPDNFREGLDTYLEWTRQVNEEGKKVKTNSETEGRFHSNWLSMMYPRLKLARNLLTDDGLVFLSIDDAELRNLWALCCEIFGENNSIACLPRRTKTGGGSASNHFAIEHDYVIVFARNKNKLGPIFAPHDAVYAKRYAEEDEVGRYFWDTMERSSTATRPYVIVAPDGTELRGKWFRSEARFKSDLESGEVRFLKKPDGSWSVQFKQRLAEGKKIRSLLVDNDFRATPSELESLGLGRVFSFPKPVHLIKHLLTGTTMGDDIILDFFAGSGTTAHAVMELNSLDGGQRRFIAVQLPEPTPEDSDARVAGFETIAAIARRRIAMAAEKLGADRVGMLKTTDVALDLGYRAYKLSDTNFAKWRIDDQIDETKLEQHLLSLQSSAADSATADDLLTEILLKQGYSLTERISSADIAGLEVHSVGDGIVLAYLDEKVKPTLMQLRAVVDLDPQKIIILEDAFQGDDELKTNVAQLTKSKGIEMWTA